MIKNTHHDTKLRPHYTTLYFKVHLHYPGCCRMVAPNPPEATSLVSDIPLHSGWLHCTGGCLPPHTAQTKLSPVTTILNIWQTAEGPPSADPPFLTLLYHERFVPPDHYLRPIGGLGWQHKAPRIIESVSFREYPPAGPTQFNLCHFLA